MAMPYARHLGAYHPEDETVTVTDLVYAKGPRKGDPYRVKLDDLNGAEMFKACAAVGVNPKSLDTMAERIAAVRVALGQGTPWVPQNAAGSDVHVSGAATAIAAASVETATEAPKAESDDADALADAIRKLAGKASVSEDDVRGIVNPMLDTFRADVLAEAHRPQVIEITLPDREPITLSDRQHEVFPDVLRLVGARLHVYLVGPPGTGKSTIAHSAANALGLHFASQSCYATMTATALFGYMDATGNYVSTEFRRCYEDGGVFLLDEIDNGNPNVLAAINQALANGSCAFPDGMVKRHDDFVMLSAANTYGTGATRQFIGRNALDAATLDRFVMVEVPIDEALETELTVAQSSEHGPVWLDRVRRYRANVEKHGLMVVISPRASIEGARMLKAGFTLDQVEAMRVFRGVAPDQVAKIKG